MKKIFGLLILLGAIAAAVVYVILLDKDVKDPKELLPSTTVVYVEYEDLFDDIEFIGSTKLGTFVKNFDAQKLMKTFETPEEEIKKYEQTLADLKNAVPVIKGAFSGKATFAFDGSVLEKLKEKETEQGFENPEVILDGVLFFFEPLISSTFLASVDSLFEGHYPSTQETYKNRTLKTLELDRGLTATYVLTNGTTIASFSKDTIKQCIDRADAKTPVTFAQNQEFSAMAKRFKPGYRSLTYCNLNKFFSFYMTVLEDMMKKSSVNVTSNQFDTLKASYSAMGTLAEAGYRKGNVTNAVTHLTYDMSKFPEESQNSLKLLSPEGIKKIDKMIPSDSALFAATSGMNFNALYTQMNQANAKVDYDQANPMFQQFFGLSITEFINAFDSTIGYAVGKPSQAAFFPTAQLSVFIELKETEKVKQALQRALSSGFPIPKKEIAHKDAQLTSIPVPMVGIAPTFTIYNDFLIISTDADYLKRVIDVKDTPECLAQKPGYKKLIQKAPNAVQSAAFFGEKGHAVIKPFINYYLEKNPPKDEKNIAMANDVLIPLAECITTIKSSYITSEMDEKGGTIYYRTEWQ